MIGATEIHVARTQTENHDMANTMKVAIVTGAGTGVGRAAALALSRKKYTVVLAGRRASLLEETAKVRRRLGWKYSGRTQRRRKPRIRKNLFTKTHSAFGRLDLLFNNAGLGAPPVPLEDLTVDQWQQVVDVNLTGSFLCTQEAFRIMKNQDPIGGRIINNGSVSAQAPRPRSIPYTATKHAITGLTRSTALDGRAHRIACGQIDIGNAETEMTEKMKDGVAQANGTIAPEPTMNVEHVADAVLHMADLPLDANILFMTVMATNMPLVGRG